MPAANTASHEPKTHLGRLLIPFHVVAVAMLAALTLLPGPALG
jgi:hypothetical protein